MSRTTRILSGYLVALLACVGFPLATFGQTQGRTVSVHPSLEMEISSNGMTVLPGNPLRAGELWIIPAGTHPVRRVAEVDGRRYALIPMTLQNKVERRPYYAYIRGYKCGSDVRHYAAVDLETRELKTKTWLTSDEPCEGVDYWDKGFRVRDIDLPINFSIRQHESVASGEVAIADRRQREQDDAIRRRQEVSRANNTAAPAKRVIGTTLCSIRHGMGYAGYTEQVSEETGRISIRIVRHFNPANGRFLKNISPEENIWEHPDNWYMCDF